MTSTTTHLLPTPDGRTLAVDVHGPADGPVVLFLHSAPGSRRFDPDPAATAAAGVRLVTVDRAGYGGSTPLAASVVPTIPGHAADAALVLDALEAGPVAVAGWSAGGRIAAALAARRPELVRSLAILATPAPDGEVPWVTDEQRAMADDWRTHPEDAVGLLEQAFGDLPAALADDAVARSQVAAGTADEALLAARPELAAALVTMVRAGFEPGVAGVAADIVADQVSPWGFDPGEVGAPARCWYGGADEVVAPAHGAWWVERLPDAELTVAEDVGHLVVATAWADVLDHLVHPS